MYLTQYTDYALRVLMYAAANDKELVNIGTIADAYGISKSHLMKVVTALVKGGFLLSVRGKGGGLRLARPAEEITIGEVVRCLEPHQLVECMGERSQCNCLVLPHCRLAGVLSGAYRSFIQHLDGVTLAEIVNPAIRHTLQEPLVRLKQG